MTAETLRGLLDTNILILRHWIEPQYLPEEMAISTVTLAELTAGVHFVNGSDAAAAAERARRIDVLQRAESEFDPIPFDLEAARCFGQIAAATRATGRTHRRQTADLMIAATALAEGLTLYTTNPDDFKGLETLLKLAPVPRPPAN